MILEEFKSINTLIFDVDGVFTDSQLIVDVSGDMVRKVSVRDGLAVTMALKEGYMLAIITGGSSPALRKRMESLGIKHIYDGVKDKSIALKDLVDNHGVDLSKSLYMGDDLPDLAVADAVRIFCCPADAEPEIIEKSRYICQKNGGDGAVREVIKIILKLNDQWPAS